MKAQLTRTTKGPEAGDIRPIPVEGFCKEPPVAGRPFRIFCKPVTEGAVARMVETSFVVDVIVKPDGCDFVTETGSSYQLVFLE